MNDPMEGAFLSNLTDRELSSNIWSGKRQLLICCFSTDYRHTLLWSHYADSHQGCCLEVEVTSNLAPHEVQYTRYMPVADSGGAIEILSHKSEFWQYEDEIRFFKNDKNEKGNRTHPYLSVKITKVLLGYRMSSGDVAFYSSLIHSILGDDIEVRRIEKNELNTGFESV